MRSRSGRQTHSDRPSEDEAQGALRPMCPAEGAINPNRQTSARRKERSTPSAGRVSSDRSNQLQLAGQVSSGRRTNVKLQPPDWTEDEGPASTPSFRPALPAKDQRQLRIGSNSLVVDHSGERIILRSYPCNRDHAPRVSMVGNLGKSLTMQSLSRLGDRQKRACGAPFQNRRQIVHKT